MPKMIRQLLDRAAHPRHTYTPPPLPRRGDHVEAWLKAQRDSIRVQDAYDARWVALLDELLDDDRLHADTGTPLDQHACEGSFCEHDEETTDA